MKDSKEFLKYICGSKWQLKVYKNGYMIPVSLEKIETENQHGDIYYVVNTGGTKDYEINKYNANFIDWDCGRDKDKNYYPLEVVKDYKEKVLLNLDGFLKPTLIVETRNGFHVYWVYKEEENTTPEQWIQIQEKLIKKFNSDRAIKNPARLMRLPFTKWMKDKNNPFTVNINTFNDIRYSFAEIVDSLEDIESNLPVPVKLNNVIVKRVKENNIDYIKRLDVKGLKHKLMGRENVPTIEKNINFYSIVGTKTPPKIYAHNRQEVYEILKTIDLYDFLGIDETMFNCIFHRDNTPSANIIYNEDTGHSLYKCFSSQCNGKVFTIISIVEKLARCNKPKAINFLKEVYNIELIESEWQKETKELLQSNIDYLLSGNLEIEFPLLYKTIKKYIPLLITLHNLAINNVYDESLSDEQKIVFFASIRYIADLIDYGDKKRIGDRINLFAFIDLIGKLSEEDIPEDLLIRAKHEAEKKKQKEIVNFYSIPSYTIELLQEAEKLSKLFKENNGTMRGWSRELLVRTFGDDVADKVYPKQKGKKLNDKINQFAEIYKSILCAIVLNKGYTTENECLEFMEGRFSLKQMKGKKVLQQCLKELHYNRIRTNKEIKEKYGVAENGYPFIIVA